MDPLKLTSMVRDYKGVVKLVPEPENPRFICDAKYAAASGGLKNFLDGFLESFSQSVIKGSKV